MCSPSQGFYQSNIEDKKMKQIFYFLNVYHDIDTGEYDLDSYTVIQRELCLGIPLSQHDIERQAYINTATHLICNALQLVRGKLWYSVYPSQVLVSATMVYDIHHPTGAHKMFFNDYMNFMCWDYAVDFSVHLIDYNYYDTSGKP